jgi:5-methylcytosine-specific restriction protein A
MSPDSQPVARLCLDVINSEPSRRTAMLLIETCLQVARKLDAHDREIVGFAMCSTANDLVGPQLAESTKWHSPPAPSTGVRSGWRAFCARRLRRSDRFLSTPPIRQAATCGRDVTPSMAPTISAATFAEAAMPKSALDYLYKTSRWKNVRAAHIRKFPVCERCAKFGRVTPAVLVDHHPPHDGDVAAFWDSKRFRSLCFRCHGVARGEQKKGYSSAVGLDGRPTDPAHPANAVRRHLPPLADDGDDPLKVCALDPHAPRARTCCSCCAAKASARAARARAEASAAVICYVASKARAHEIALWTALRGAGIPIVTSGIEELVLFMFSMYEI